MMRAGVSTSTDIRNNLSLIIDRLLKFASLI